MIRWPNPALNQMVFQASCGRPVIAVVAGGRADAVSGYFRTHLGLGLAAPFTFANLEACHLWEHDWLFASMAAVVWISLFGFTRSTWFKMDRKDFPNEQEIV